MSKSPYKLHPTPARPREALAPIGPAPVDEPSPDSSPTLVPCPSCHACSACSGTHEMPCPSCGKPDVCPWCADCSYCGGTHVVTPARAAEFRKR